jgi:hypothetical protein
LTWLRKKKNNIPSERQKHVFYIKGKVVREIKKEITLKLYLHACLKPNSQNK